MDEILFSTRKWLNHQFISQIFIFNDLDGTILGSKFGSTLACLKTQTRQAYNET